MADPDERLSDLLAAPLEEIIVALGSGIGRAQAEMDRHSIETQRRLDEDPVLAQYGMQATWYQLPRTELELRVAVGMRAQEARTTLGEVTPAPRPGAPATEFVAGTIMPPTPRLYIEPVNARYQNQFGYDVQATSLMRLVVTPVPPPSVAGGPPRMSADEVLAVARETDAWFVQGDDPGWRTAVNFNAGLRVWFVVQSREENDVVVPAAWVKVDDASGGVLKAIRP